MNLVVAFLLRYWQPIVLGIIVVAAIAAYKHQIAEARNEGRKIERELCQQRINDAVKAAQVIEDAKQAKWNQQRKEADDAAKREIQKANAIARSERVSVDRLREQLAAIGDTGSQTCASAGTLTVSPTIRVLADIAGQCASEYQQLAAAAREGYARGKACEAQYDGLR